MFNKGSDLFIASERIVLPNRPSDSGRLGIRPGDAPFDSALGALGPFGTLRRPETFKAGQATHLAVPRAFHDFVDLHSLTSLPDRRMRISGKGSHQLSDYCSL